MGPAEFTAKGSVTAKVALGGFYLGSFLYFETRPVLLFCVFGIGGWESNDSVVEVGFQCEDVVGCVCYPAVSRPVIFIGRVGWMVWSADCEDGHVMDAHGEEG